jgi:NAD(P)-dependent dehydrogenase (short-subunit alcohol dehydrogenase family)
MDLEGRVTVITGAASGIGRAVAERFAKEGAKVVAADIDDSVNALTDSVGAVAVTADLSREDGVKRIVDVANEAFGQVDLMFSNAGIGTMGGVDTSDEAWMKIWQINVMSHIYAARAVLPQMIERGEGYICSTASAAGLLTQIGSAPYAVTKHAAVALAEWIAITHGHQGIRSSVLCPQAVRTKMTAGGPGVAGVDGMLEPEAVAEDVVEAIREERFLILPHKEVVTYMQRKTSDYDRWIVGMQRLQERMQNPNQD